MSAIIPTLTDADFKKLQGLLADFERKNPGEMAQAAAWARAVSKDVGRNKYNVSSSQSGSRQMLELPTGVYMLLKKHYPSILTNKQNLRWFVRKFPELMIPEKL